MSLTKETYIDEHLCQLAKNTSIVIQKFENQSDSRSYKWYLRFLSEKMPTQEIKYCCFCGKLLD